MMEQHTPEPWSNEGFVYLYEGGRVRQIVGAGELEVVGETGLSEPDARRIVACVNACAGIITEELEQSVGIVAASIDAASGFVDLAKEHRDELISDLATAEQDSRQKQARIDRLERERDELLAALEHVIDGSLSLPRFAGEQARAAIARVKGGAA